MSNPTLGTIVKRLRTTRNWTLSEMSGAVGIPVSTLSKIENDKLTLTYDKLQQLARALQIPLADLFVQSSRKDSGPVVTGRRSVAQADNTVEVTTKNYHYAYLCSDLRHRRMIPVHARITARTLAEFGELVRHNGEEFAYVLSGAVALHTEFYEPTLLGEGEGVYIDSTMGHAYLVQPGYEEAIMLVVCSSSDDQLQEELIADAEGRAAADATGAIPPPGLRSSRKPRKTPA